MKPPVDPYLQDLMNRVQQYGQTPSATPDPDFLARRAQAWTQHWDRVNNIMGRFGHPTYPTPPLAGVYTPPPEPQLPNPPRPPYQPNPFQFPGGQPGPVQQQPQPPYQTQGVPDATPTQLPYNNPLPPTPPIGRVPVPKIGGKNGSNPG